MTPERRLTRRRFIALGAISLAAASAGTVKLIGGNGADPRKRLPRRVAASFTDLRSATLVGEAYRREHAGENDRRRLVNLLSASNGAWLRVSRPAEIRRLARAEAHRDYRGERMAAVGGWYLSQTEVRLCALASLAVSSPSHG